MEKGMIARLHEAVYSSRRGDLHEFLRHDAVVWASGSTMEDDENEDPGTGDSQGVSVVSPKRTQRLCELLLDATLFSPDKFFFRELAKFMPCAVASKRLPHFPLQMVAVYKARLACNDQVPFKVAAAFVRYGVCFLEALSKWKGEADHEETIKTMVGFMFGLVENVVLSTATAGASGGEAAERTMFHLHDALFRKIWSQKPWMLDRCIQCALAQDQVSYPMMLGVLCVHCFEATATPTRPPAPDAGRNAPAARKTDKYLQSDAGGSTPQLDSAFKAQGRASLQVFMTEQLLGVNNAFALLNQKAAVNAVQYVAFVPLFQSIKASDLKRDYSPVGGTPPGAEATAEASDTAAEEGSSTFVGLFARAVKRAPR
jgi:hypothetical protein